MSHTTQRIANRFPLWTKVRSDPSSMGQRFFSAVAPLFDHMGITAVKVRDEFRLLRPHLGVGQLWYIDLEEDEYFSFALTSSGLRVPTYHTSVVGTASATPYTLDRDEYLEDLLYGAPTRLSLYETTAVTTYTVWESTAPTTYNTITVPERLTVKVEGSTLYKIRKANRNREASNNWFVQVTGDDINGNEVTETIRVLDDGVYQTQHIFSSVEEVTYDGFDGDVTVLAGQKGVDITDWFRVAVTQELEGELLLNLSTAVVSATTRTFLTQYTNILKNGWEYRTSEGTTPDGNTETVCEQVLRDSSGVDFTGVDLAISPENAYLYVVDSAGYLHVFDHTLPSFTPPDDETMTSYISLLPLRPFAKFGEEEYLWTWFRQPKANVVSVQIKRVAPDGTIRYLQADKTWGAGTYSFTGASSVLPEGSWNDLRMATTYDQLGQWDYYCTVTTSLGDTTISHTAVQCGTLTALVSIDTGVVSPTGLWFSHDGKVCVSNATQLKKFSEHRDTYYADPENQKLYLREEYDTVEVTV